MSNLVLKETISQSRNNIRLYNADYDDVPCYCISHQLTGYKAIFSHDDSVLDAVIQRLSRSAIAYDRKNTGAGSVFKFRRTEADRSISLRLYLYAQYHNLSLDNVTGHKIEMRNFESLPDNISDFRKENLYDAGGQRPENINVLERPDHPDEKYIVISCEGRIEIQDYSDDLFELLQTKSLCDVSKTGSSRLSARVHYAHRKDGYKIFNLSRLVLLYYLYYPEYRETSDSLKHFVQSLVRLTDTIEHCGHVNACNWNNCTANLLPMSSQANMAMSNHIRHICGQYRMFAIGIQEHEDNYILVAFTNRGAVKYFKCTVDEYADLQRKVLGKDDITKGVIMNYIFTCEDKVLPAGIDTPEQAYAKYKNQSREIDTSNGAELLSSFWEWCDDRDRLLNLYVEQPDMFKRWPLSYASGFEGQMNLVRQLSALLAGCKLDAMGFNITPIN